MDRLVNRLLSIEKSLQIERESLRRELRDIYTSKAWRAIATVRKMRGQVRHLLRGRRAAAQPSRRGS